MSRLIIIDGGGVVGVPPTDIASNTGWWDFTDASLLYFDINRTVPISSDGEVVKWAEAHDTGGSNYLVIYRNNVLGCCNYQTGEVNGKSIGRFDDATSTIRGDLKYYAKSGLSDNGAIPCTDLLSASGKTVVMGINIASASGAGPYAYANNPIWGDSGNRFQIGCQAVDASNVSVRPYNYDGTEDQAALTVPRNQFVILSVWHDGTTLKARYNRGTWSEQASGATDSFSGNVTIGQPGAPGYTIFDLAHMASFNAALSDTDLAAVEDYIASQLGISL